MTSLVPSSDLSRAGISDPAVPLAAPRKSKVDSVDRVDSQARRRGRVKTLQPSSMGPAGYPRAYRREIPKTFFWKIRRFWPRNSGGGVGRVGHDERN